MTLDGIRTILVPPDIVPVQRRSPLPARKRTPWHPRPDGEGVTERPGGREWFSDHLFVEAQDGHVKAGYGTSITAHVSLAVVLLTVFVARSDQGLLVRVRSSLAMPVMLSMPVAEAASPAAASSVRTVAQAPAAAPAPAPPAAAPPVADVTAAPVEAPSSIEPETGIEHGIKGVEGGVEGGVAGGVEGGVLNGSPAGAAGPLRVGSGGITPPRKIKDVKPLFPQGAVADQAGGIVIIEATIGIDGTVKDAKVLRSIPQLDQAALDAVRQWEYMPSRVNGVPVSVVMTIIVKFAIL